MTVSWLRKPWLATCQKTRVEDIHATQCLAYLLGFNDGTTFANYTGRRICVPKEVSTGELVRVVLKYLRENRSKLRLDRVLGVQAALQGAYPCR
jgi:Ssp1 endopeptidase immunity protein Rap1a